MPQDQLLISNVGTMDIECFDGTQWRPMWDTTQTDSNLPTAVRISIQLTGSTPGDTQNREPVELVVPIDLQTTTNQTSTGETS